MASKPETTFYRSIHKLLGSTCYNEKMYNPLRGGTPDVWYSGDANDLWVEYKWLPKVPKKAPIRMEKLLSPLQLIWLNRREEEGRNVAVILGTPEGAWIYDDSEWLEELDPSRLRERQIDKHKVADYIKRRVCRNVATKPVFSGEND